MHHIPTQERTAALTHMFRVLRPGGRLLIADLHPTGHLVPAVIRALARVTSRDGADPFDELDLRRYTDALRHAGFVDLTFAVTKPWTGFLTAATPE
jgi:ubiquinone/menaquinone biosynthesis C-methylase UbiE